MAREFAGEIYRNHLSSRTIARMLSAAHSFYRYLIREDYVQINPFEDVSASKSARKLPTVLTAGQAIRLVNIPGDDMPAVPRPGNCCFVLFLRNSPARIGQA